MNPLNSFNISLVLPAVILTVTALLVLMVEAFAGERLLALPTRLALAWISVLGFVITAVVEGFQWGQPVQTDPAGMLRSDPYTAFLTILFCAGGVLTVLLSYHYLEHVGAGAGEYYCLLIFSAVGAFLMAASYHLVMVFLGLEILSVAIYPLAGFLRRDPRSNEAAVKYFLLGAFSSAFFLYGMALVYGAVGMHFMKGGSSGGEEGWGLLRFDVIANYVTVQSEHSPIFWAGIGLLLVSFCFKAALAPFHMWTPDAYDGAPTPITAYMGSVIKAAAFAPFFRFFLDVLGRRQYQSFNTASAYDTWALVVTAIAILTMTWGSLAAVAEPSVKRMLAYSSVAHAGYIAIALVAESYSSLLFYLGVYLLMVIGSFGCVSLVSRRGGGDSHSIQEWTGLGLRHPWLGAAMSLFLFALAGFPPTAGFMGKLGVFRAALETGQTVHQNGYVGLVVIALLNSLVSVYYYLRLVMVMYHPASEGAERVTVHHDRLAGLAIALCALGVILFGVFPGLLMGPLARHF